MRRLVQLIVDYEPGDPAFAEQPRRLELGVPDCLVKATGDTPAVGLCVARLALADGPPGWMAPLRPRAAA
jgi:hypothetical protein